MYYKSISSRKLFYIKIFLRVVALEYEQSFCKFTIFWKTLILIFVWRYREIRTLTNLRNFDAKINPYDVIRVKKILLKFSFFAWKSEIRGKVLCNQWIYLRNFNFSTFFSAKKIHGNIFWLNKSQLPFKWVLLNKSQLNP